MSKYLSSLLLCITIAICCHAQIPSVTSFTFKVAANSQYLSQEIVCDIYGDSLIVGIVPYNTHRTILTANIETTDSATATIGAEPLISGISTHDFSAPADLFLSLPGQNPDKKYTVILKSTGLPAVYINTQNEAAIESKDVYVNAAIGIYPNAQFESAGVYQEALQIKGRGNSTWGMPKKPYKLKLNKKASLFGLPSDKEWILLANYSDKTLIRNSLAFETGKRFGLTYNPGYQAVDLFLNGRYQGSYLLTEQIKIAAGRVAIEELKSTDTTEAKISGGYLLEVDERLDEEFWFRTTRNVPFTIKEPTVNPQQLAYITQYVQQAEDALYGNNFTDPQTGYEAYLNTESFINWYLVSELFKNNDAIFYSSVFLYKDKNSKLAMGPLWDFDISAGNINYNGNDNPQGWWIRIGPWISRLFDDPSFRKRVNDRWAALKSSQINTLPLFIDQMAAKLEGSQTENFRKWDILNTNIWPNPIVTGSYQGEIDYLKNWLTERINWLDQEFSIPVLVPFGLTAPASEYKTTLSATHPSTINFSWQKADNLVKYRWVLTTEQGSFSVPVASSMSYNQGNDLFYSISSADLITALQMQNINPGDSTRLKWTVYAYVGTDSLAASQSFVLNVKIEDVLSPFALITPADHMVAEPEQLASLHFSWRAAKAASHYRVYLYTSTDQAIFRSFSANNGKDTTFGLSKSQMQNLLVAHGKVKADSLIACLKWTVYAYLPNTDSLKASGTNLVTLFHKEPVREPVSIELATPPNQSGWSASEDSTRKTLFSWSIAGQKTGDYFKLYCTTANAFFSEPLFVHALTDTFVALTDPFINKLLEEIGTPKGDSVLLKWTVYQFNPATPDSVKANRDFLLQVTRDRLLKPFAILSPANGDRIESMDNDSFADVTFTWEHNPDAAYTLSASVNGTLFETATGNAAALLLKNTDIKHLFNAANDPDSVSVEFAVTAVYQGDSLECSPITVKFVRNKLASGLKGYNAFRNAVTMYPNPVSGNAVTFSISGQEQKQIVIEITDLTGKVLQSFVTSHHEFTSDISGLNNGIYFCRISTKDESCTYKFVVNK